MISVVIPTYRNPKCLDWCLKSAIENAHGDDFEIIVIVDGFFEESHEVLKNYALKANILDLGDNFGMQHALNMGVFNASGDKILIVNDDNVFPYGWDTIISGWGNIVSPRTVVTLNQIEPTGPSIFNFKIKDFGNPDNFDLDAYSIWERDNRTREWSNDGGIFPFVMSKRDYMMVGGFDTLYQSPFICDWDFFLKLEMAGCTFKRTDNMAFYHFGSVATKNRTDGEAERFKQSEQYAFQQFEYKWGFPAFRGENNTHMPRGKKVRGIQF